MSNASRSREPSARLKRVLVLFPASYVTHCEIKGIMRYRREHRTNWIIDVREINELKSGALKLTPENHDAVIGNIAFPGYRGLFRALAIPAVLIHSDLSRLKISRRVPWYGYLFADNHTIVDYALRYLLARGFKSFAYVGAADRRIDSGWSDERQQAAVHLLSQRGIICNVYPNVRAALARNFSLEERQLGLWLRRLPPMTAVIAANDQRAEQVLSACQQMDIQVPEELAVLGIDNVAERCEATAPTLSSVAIDYEGVGYRAAELLDGYFRQLDELSPTDLADPADSGKTRSKSAPSAKSAGEHPTLTPFAIPFASPMFIERASTDNRISSDLLVRRACELINAADGCHITVTAILERLRVSKRSLETHFRATLGRTPFEEIARVRLDHLKTLLRDPTLTRTAIAERCGFASTAHLAYFFRLHTGQTIRTFRNQIFNARQ